jgi:hypothetical protein
MRHAIKVAAVSGQTPARDVALLSVFYGTGMTATEVAQLEVADVLAEGGEYRTVSESALPSLSTAGAGRSSARTRVFARRSMRTSSSACGCGTASLPGARNGGASFGSGRCDSPQMGDRSR